MNILILILLSLAGIVLLVLELFLIPGYRYLCVLQEPRY